MNQNESKISAYRGGVSPADDWANLPGTPSNAAPTMTPIKKMHRLLRGRYAIALTLAAAGAIAGAVAGYESTRPKFRSQGIVEIRPIIQNALTGDKMMLMYQAYIQNQVALLSGPRVLGAALSSQEWAATRRGSSPDVQTKFEDNLEVQVQPGTTYILVKYLDADRDVALAAVQAVIRSYKQIYGNVNTNETQEKMTILENQRQKTASLINEKRNLMLGYARQIGTADVAAYFDEKLKNLADLQNQLSQVTLQLNDVEALVKPSAATQPSGAIAGLSAPAPAKPKMTETEIAAVDPTMKEMLAQRRTLQSKYDRAAAIGPNARMTLDAKADVDIQNGEIARYVDDFRTRYVAIAIDPQTNTPVPVSAATLDQLRTRVAFLQTLVDNEKKETHELSSAKLNIQTLDNEIAKLKEELDTTDHAIAELSSETLMSGNLNVISEGYVPAQAAVDRRKQMAALGLIGGSSLPLGLLMLIGLMDSRHRFSDEITTDLSGVPLLGILPDLPDLLSNPEQASVAAHCVHQIRTMLQLSSESQNRRVFAVTSPSPGDGKTSLTLALGLSFAATGSKTLLIDADLIGAGLTARMNTGRPEGVLEAIASRTMLQHVVKTDVENLSILPVGSARPSASAMLTPAAVQRMVAEARNQYDVILIDTGPILGSIEASPVSVAADGVILTVARGQSRQLVEKSLAHLVAIGARLSGVVFNRANTYDFRQSISRMSMQRLPSPYVNGNHPDSSVTQPTNIGPIARAVQEQNQV
jgi:polysaccharide biosynthesis transport protein